MELIYRNRFHRLKNKHMVPKEAWQGEISEIWRCMHTLPMKQRSNRTTAGTGNHFILSIFFSKEKNLKRSVTDSLSCELTCTK